MKTDLRKLNFNAGPASLPEEVLEMAGRSVREYEGSGISILELPHRGKAFHAIVEEANALVRELAGLNDDFEICWMQGGGRQQFAMIPMNFLAQTGEAGYVVSGHWAEEAMQNADFYGTATSICSSKEKNFSELPIIINNSSEGLSYVHLTTNNTIFGTQWHEIPRFNAPLVADMSSDIFSMKRNYSDFDLIYAVAQKNMGIAGNCMVIVKKAFLEKQVRSLPPIFDYKAHIRENSALNTANVFGIYTSLLMLRWIKARTLAQIEADNILKSNLLYSSIDNSAHFAAHIQRVSDRSRMNVCFSAMTPEARQKFDAGCTEARVTGVTGHRSVGGYRVSLYNAIPVEWVRKLTDIIDSI
jgi:phosphoserine aminotransferase